MKKKTRLYLISGNKKEYEVVTIYTSDGCIFVFPLNEWDMYESDEWVEFKKMDKSVMEVFSMVNISHITFVNKGGHPVEGKPTLTPVA